MRLSAAFCLLLSVGFVSADVHAAKRTPLGFEHLDGHVLYFVMLDRFANGDPALDRPGSPDPRGSFQGGDLEGLRQKLPYLADLGVTALWISPLAVQVESVVNGAGFPDAAYHGYWPDDLLGIEPRFGSPEAFSRLVDEAHALGLRIVLDVVINHVGYGSSLEARSDWIRAGANCPSTGDATDRTRCLFGLPDFRTELSDVRKLVVARTLRWAVDDPIDGFRLDALKHVDPELIVELRTALKQARPEAPFLLLGEDWGAGPSAELPSAIADGRADTLVDFSFDGLAEGFLNGRLRAEALAHHLERRHGAAGPPMAHFLDNHDTTSLLARLPSRHRHRYPLAGVLQMTVRGMPTLTWGNEIGRLGGRWPDNRAFMDWDALGRPAAARVHRLWRELIHLRRAKPALSSRQFRTLRAQTDASGGGATLVYARGGATGEVLVGLRRGPGSITLPLPPGTWCLDFATESGVLLVDNGPAETLSLHLPADAAALLSGCRPSPPTAPH